jgi:hypothetical protein
LLAMDSCLKKYSRTGRGDVCEQTNIKWFMTHGSRFRKSSMGYCARPFDSNTARERFTGRTYISHEDGFHRRPEISYCYGQTSTSLTPTS